MKRFPSLPKRVVASASDIFYCAAGLVYYRHGSRGLRLALRFTTSSSLLFFATQLHLPPNGAREKRFCLDQPFLTPDDDDDDSDPRKNSGAQRAVLSRTSSREIKGLYDRTSYTPRGCHREKHVSFELAWTLCWPFDTSNYTRRDSFENFLYFYKSKIVSQLNGENNFLIRNRISCVQTCMDIRWYQWNKLNSSSIQKSTYDRIVS